MSNLSRRSRVIVMHDRLAEGRHIPTPTLSVRAWTEIELAFLLIVLQLGQQVSANTLVQIFVADRHGGPPLGWGGLDDMHKNTEQQSRRWELRCKSFSVIVLSPGPRATRATRRHTGEQHGTVAVVRKTSIFSDNSRGGLRVASVETKALQAIRRKGRGYVFTPAELLALGSRAAVDQALSRLTRRGEIQRLGRGVYHYPEVSPRLGALSPKPEAVAEALARREGAQLQTSGARAANALGLTTQVPARLTFLTDGTPRSRRVGNQVIELKRAAPRKLRGAGTLAGTVLQALRYLGPERLDYVVQHLSSILSSRDKRELKSMINAAPGWARRALEQIITSESAPDARDTRTVVERRRRQTRHE